MVLRILKILLVSVLLSCGGGSESPDTLVLEKIVNSDSFPIRVHEIDNDTLIIADLVSGILQKFNYKKNTSVSIFTFAPADANANGISGLLIDNEFNKNGFIYVYHFEPTYNKNVLSRLTFFEDQVLDNKIIAFFEPGSGHNGGGLAQDEYGNIYIGIGDVDTPGEAPNVNSLRGKIVKISRDGLRKSVFASGLRNPFGIVFIKKQLFAADNGPGCNDKILRVTEHSRFSWNESYSCTDDIVNQNGIVYQWSKSEGLTDVEVSPSGLLKDKKVGLLTSRYNTKTLTFLELSDDKSSVISETELFFQAAEGPFIDIHYGNSGTIYLTSPLGVYRLMK